MTTAVATTAKTATVHTTMMMHTTVTHAGFMQAGSTVYTTTKRTWFTTCATIAAAPFTSNTSKPQHF